MKSAAVIAALLALASAQTAEDRLELVLLHTNDMHARFEEITPLATTCHEQEKNKSCVAGFARLAHEIRRYRADGRRKALFLNAGDTFVGTNWYNVHKWKICADFLNALEPDVMSLGNHELDDGLVDLQKFLETIKCPIVCANMDNAKLPVVKKSTVLDVDGHKIGIVGYLTQEVSYLPDTKELNVSDEILAVREETEKLDAAGIKIIIALGHSGFKIDRQIAAEVPLVDVVIGGHSNTFLWNGPKPHEEEVQGPYPFVIEQSTGKKVPVVQAYAHAMYLGRLNATFDHQGDLVEFSGQPEYLSSDIPQDEDILKLLESYRPAVEKLNREIVGSSSVFLDGNCRLVECNFGNLVADAMIYYSAYNNRMEEQTWTKAAIALYNAGNIRNSINVTYTRGNITKGELSGALPFSNDVVTVVLSGTDLLQCLEHAVENYESNFVNAQFLQVSGLRVLYDLSLPPGSRVVKVEVRCSNCTVPIYEPLKRDNDYTVITNDYLLNGGDGFDVIKENKRDVRRFDLSMFELMLWYLKMQSPVFAEVQGRIKFVGMDDKSAQVKLAGCWLPVAVLSMLLLMRC